MPASILDLEQRTQRCLALVVDDLATRHVVLDGDGPEKLRRCREWNGQLVGLVASGWGRGMAQPFAVIVRLK